MTPTSRTLRALAACGVVVALAGCGGGNQGGGGSTSKSPSSTAASPSAGSSSPANAASSQRLVAAGATALNKVGKGTVTSVDAEQGGRVWEVQVITSGGVEHEVDVSRNGKEVVPGPRTKREDAQDKAENRHEVRGVKLDYQAAAEKVIAARAGRITELNLDESRGKIVWEADVHRSGSKYELTIDAASGNVVKNKPDRGGDDDDDD